MKKLHYFGFFLSIYLPSAYSFQFGVFQRFAHSKMLIILHTITTQGDIVPTQHPMPNPVQVPQNSAFTSNIVQMLHTLTIRVCIHARLSLGLGLHCC